VNCGAVPESVFESEMFGHEAGAFTGAAKRRIGKIEHANGGTLLLDEIESMPLALQVKLLRVVQERRLERLGGNDLIPVDCRIVAATKENLLAASKAGRFREDLFYRLNVFPIQVPPLRDRREDIPLLVWRFVDEFSKSFGKRIDAIAKDSMTALQHYAWPGNIRELRNVVERAMIIATGPQLSIALPVSPAMGATKTSGRIVDVEREHIRGVLESSRWRIRGLGGAAERLGLPPTTLETRMAKLGLVRPKPAGLPQ
jgi:transcriptional regulator with GAF, ATPase, and Fis domain